MAKDIKKQKTNTLTIFDIVVPISNWLPTKDVYHGDLNYRTTRFPHDAFQGWILQHATIGRMSLVHLVIVPLPGIHWGSDLYEFGR
jgi:hypothetical protein